MTLKLHPSCPAALDRERRRLTVTAIELLATLIELDTALQSPNLDPGVREEMRSALSANIKYLRSLTRSLYAGTDHGEPLRALLESMIPDS